jgi:hypothetical protein
MKLIDSDKLIKDVEKSMNDNSHEQKIFAQIHRTEHIGFLSIISKQQKLKYIVMPCNVGDNVYVIPSKTNYRLNKLHRMTENNRVHTQIVNEIRFYNNNQYMITTCYGFCNCLQQDLGESWFLTQKEAEEKLKELEKENE